MSLSPNIRFDGSDYKNLNKIQNFNNDNYKRVLRNQNSIINFNDKLGLL